METGLTVPVDEPDHPDYSPIGSPELTHSHFPPPSDHLTLTDDLRVKIIKQVEYYFSDENLSTDQFLMKHITKDGEGFVPIRVIASFRKMKKLTRDVSLIVAALKESSLLVVSANGKRVKRVHPLPFTEVRDPQLYTILVENLPEDHSEKNLRQIFGEVGNVKHITIRDPHSAKESRKCTVAEKLLSGKLYALVEYDTVEAAERAVDTLNNEQDWRFGLRVKLLKKMGKPGQKKKVWRESDPEKNTPDSVGHDEDHHLSDHQGDSHDEEEGEQFAKSGQNLPKEKNDHRARNQGRGRRQKHRGANGQGHGQGQGQGQGHGHGHGQGHGHGHGHGHSHGSSSTSHNYEPAKPPPGPKMPDGTKGFTMGRGRPILADPSLDHHPQ